MSVLLRERLPLAPWLGSSPGDPWLRGAFASVILSRVMGSSLCRWRGEVGRGGEGGGGRGEETDAQTDGLGRQLCPAS